MARPSEQLYISDVVSWGIVALVCAGAAVLATNLSTAVPRDMLASIHSSGRSGVGVEQLLAQVADLTERTQRLQTQNDTLSTRFALQERTGNQVIQRVGAIETTLPDLLESRVSNTSIDRSAVTAAIGGDHGTEFAADGGSVSVQQRPLQAPTVAAVNQAMPAPVASSRPPVADARQFGIAVGASTRPGEAGQAWADLSNKLGPMLLGLSPLLAKETNSDNQRILVGPIAELSEATALCTRLERLSIPCTPMPYTGTPLDF